MTDTRNTEKHASARPVITVFMLVKTRREWLELAEAERTRLLREHVEPILHDYRDQVRLRLYDTEFYSSVVTDVWVWEATSHAAYEQVVEALRETPFWDRLFDIVEILPGVENVHGTRAPVAA